ncbi:MAG: translocation/assembly module TamB [candidate division Zixibacteria bacterium]|nr:translocation/assembly module TamB [candidate division Zixibacteria bacterium]
MRKRYKIPLAALLVFFGIIAAGVLIFTQTPLLKMEVNRSLRGYLKDRYRLEVKIGGLGGNGFSELLLTDLTVDYQHPTRPYRLVKIDTLFARYQAADFFRRRWEVDSFAIRGIEGVILSDSTGRLLLPSFADENGKGGKVAFAVQKFDFERLGFRLFTPNRSWEVSSGRAAGSVQSNGDRFDFSLSRLAFSLPLETLSVRQARLAGSEADNRFQFDSFYVTTDSSRVSGKGSLRLLPDVDLEADFASTGFSFSELRRLTGLALSGDLAVAGRVRGDFSHLSGNLRADGTFLERRVKDLALGFRYRKNHFDFLGVSGELAGARWEGKALLDLNATPPAWEYSGTVEHFDLNRMVPQSLASDLSGQIEAKGVGLANKDLAIDLNLNLVPGSFNKFPISSAAGQVAVSTKEAVFAPGFRVGYLHSDYRFSGRVIYEDSASVAGTARFSDLKDFWGKLFVKKIAGRGEADFVFSGKTKDFGVEGKFRSDSIHIYDIFSENFLADFDLTRFLTRRKGEATVRFGPTRVYAVPMDSANIGFRLDSNLVVWEDGLAAGPGWRLLASGQLNLADSIHQKLTLPEAQLFWNKVPFVLRTPAQLSIDTGGVAIEKAEFRVADGTATAAGFIGYNENLDLDFSVDKVSVPSFYTFLRMKGEPLGGKASFSGQLSGPFENPRMELSGRVDSLKKKRLLLGNLSGAIRYAERRFNFEKVTFESPYGNYQLAGYLPFDMALARREKRVLDEPMKLSLSASGKRFDLLNLILPNVENLSGNFNLSLTAGGTPERPEFFGEVSLKDGRLKLMELENPIENLNTELVLKNTRLLIRGFSGTSRWKGKTGRLSAEGSLEFTSREEFGYNLRVKGEKFPFSYEFEPMEGIANFDLTVSGQTPPEVAGKIELLSLVYSGDFAEETRTTPAFTSAELSSQWDFNLHLSALNNWWIKASDVDAELKGDLYVLRQDGVYNFLGSLETIRGKYSLLGSSFRIERGVITYDDIAEANPKLDIAAVAKVRQPRTQNEATRPPDTELRILIAGTLKQPEVKPDPSSPYSEQDIVFLLASGSANPDSLGAGGGFSRRVSVGGLSLATQSLQRAAARQLGVETIEFAPEGDGNLLESRLTIGKYALPGLYIYGSSPLSTFRGQELGFEYSLGKRFYLEGIKDRNNLYRFNLNLRWEY